MSLKKATPRAVFDACEQLELLDRSWNRDDVRLTVGGGSFSVIDPLIQTWRKLQPIREVAPTVPTDLLIQVATMLEQQVSGYITEISERDSEREVTLLKTSEVLAGNLQQIESELTAQLGIAQQINHDLEAECSRLECELSEKVQYSASLETQRSIKEEAINTLNSRIKEQQEFYESGLRLQKQGQQENELRLIEQGQQQASELKLESQQQLSKQRSEMNDAAELAENRLMRLLDQSRSEMKELQLVSDKKFVALSREYQNDKQVTSKQKIEINTLETCLQQTKQLSEQTILSIEAQLVLATSEKNELKKQLGDHKDQGSKRDKSDLEQLKDSIRLLQNQVTAANK